MTRPQGAAFPAHTVLSWPMTSPAANGGPERSGANSIRRLCPAPPDGLTALLPPATQRRGRSLAGQLQGMHGAVPGGGEEIPGTRALRGPWDQRAH